MALFSDNPFVGMFRAQKRRESEAAMAAQEAMAEQEQQKQKLSSQRLEELRSIPSDLRGLEAMRKSDSLYLAGGGTFGNVFTGRRQPTEMELASGQYRKGEKVATLGSRFYDPAQGLTGLIGRSLSPKATAVNVVPARIGSGQMYSTLRSSGPYAMAPELYRRGKGTSERDRSDQFYSPTGQPMGTLLGRGAYGGFGKDATDEQGRPYSKYSPQIMERRAKRGKNPYGAESGGFVNREEPASFYPDEVPMFPFPAISTPIGRLRSFA